MILPVIISTRNRVKLLKQTLESLRKNSDNPLEIVVIDDASGSKTWDFLLTQKDIKSFRFEDRLTIAEVKKKGYELCSRKQYVYFSDDDVYFEPHWDSKLISILQKFPDIGVVGGRHHPHHQIFSTCPLNGEGQILICEQQAGYSLLLRQKDYRAIKGYEVSERTEDGGEDTLICDMIKAQGKLVASIDPPVIVHCGLKNHRGLNAADYHEMMEIQARRPEILFL